MKLYDDKVAPNPRRVRMFLAEKGIEVDIEQVPIAAKAHQQEAFLKLNPLGQVPVLELDDGRVLCESVAICRYFEELHPEPNLFGTDAFSRASIEQWNRHMELEVMTPIAQTFRNTHDFWKGRIPQAPEWGEICKKASFKRLAWLDSVLAERAYVAGDTFSIADITALVGIDFGRISKIRIAEDQPNLRRWYDEVSARPSAKA